MQSQGALDVIKGNHENVLRQLETCQRALQEERGKRFKLEHSVTALKLDGERIKDLQRMLDELR